MSATPAATQSAARDPAEPAGRGTLSILFPGPHAAPELPAEAPACLSDLNLDQLAGSVTAGREEYGLLPLFYRLLDQPAEVEYRQAVCRDLDHDQLRRSIEDFGQRMRAMRDWLEQASRVRHPLQRARLFLAAASAYCAAAESLGDGLGSADLASAGLLALRDYLRGYLASAGYGSMRREVTRLEDSLGQVRYALHIKGGRITISAAERGADYSQQVLATFAKFADASPAQELHRFKVPALLEADHVEAGILERVALLFPDTFGLLTAFFAHRQDCFDQVVSRFDREVQFYLGYLEYLRPLRAAGLALCYPRVSERAAVTEVAQAFDIVLAARLAAERRPVVCNDVKLDDPGRLMVITGPNQGGKTTYARSIGQLHYLAGLGLPVPGSSAAVGLADQIFTHFADAEQIETRSGRLQDDLVSLHEIVLQASSRSVVILNEMLTSATLADAVRLGIRVLTRIADLGSLCVCVTFVDELASLGQHTVSMVAANPQNPAEPTFRLERRPADGLAYAQAVAEQHHLSYPQVRARVTG